MEKPFQIASTYTTRLIVGIVVFAMIPIVAMVSFIKQFSFASENDFPFNIIFIFIFLCGFVFLFIFCVKSLFMIKVDCKNEQVLLQHMPIGKASQKIAFRQIQSIIFHDKQTHGDGNPGWVTSITIMDTDNKVLLKKTVEYITNYELLEELCRGYFRVDYTIGEDTYGIGIL